MVWCGVVWCGVVWCGVVWCGVVWCGVVWYIEVMVVVTVVRCLCVIEYTVYERAERSEVRPGVGGTVLCVTIDALLCGVVWCGVV